VIGRIVSVPVFFGLRIASALVLLKLTALWLPVAGFTAFVQFMLLGALLNLAAVGGAQNGLIRQAAAAQDGGLARARDAALAIWLAMVPLLLVPVLLFHGAISALLTGTRDHGPAVLALTLLALAAGPGQIWCSILSGRKRVSASLAAQGLGLVAGTAMAAWLIVRGQPVAAALGFAGGPLVTMPLSFALVRPLAIGPVRLSAIRSEAATLLHYSAALAAATGFTAIVLFALRAFYRDAMGASELGYWVAANRISDMSTQLLGLFLVQLFLPHFAALDDAAARRRFLLRCWGTGVAAMGSALLVFSLASTPLVGLFLSEAYLPAIPAIRIYMVGDVLRVWASLAMFAAFARARPARYALIEIGTVTMLAAVTVALTWAGEARAPQLGYAIAYGVTAFLVTLAFVARRGG
jgi:O-antigen/teichoic acid export membrane protein